MNPAGHIYHPYYCEENVWWRCHRWQHGVSGQRAWVCFISNIQRRCLLWQQRAVAPGEPILWDYHVVFIGTNAEGRLWVDDEDSRPGACRHLAHYCRSTFPHVLEPAAPTAYCASAGEVAGLLAEQLDLEVEALAPHFRLVAAEEFITRFFSDRSHMRDERGGWLHPPPPWPSIRTGDITLDHYLDMDQGGPGLGQRYTLEQLLHVG